LIDFDDSTPCASHVAMSRHELLLHFRSTDPPPDAETAGSEQAKQTIVSSSPSYLATIRRNQSKKDFCGVYHRFGWLEILLLCSV
jgi:hypothetical protein